MPDFRAGAIPVLLRSKYAARSRLEQVARCVYRRPPAALPTPKDDEGLRWQNIVISLQMVLECPVIVGSRTPLDLQGFGD
jgi:hypothetical protein